MYVYKPWSCIKGVPVCHKNLFHVVFGSFYFLVLMNEMNYVFGTLKLVFHESQRTNVFSDLKPDLVNTLSYNVN